MSATVVAPIVIDLGQYSGTASDEDIYRGIQRAEVEKLVTTILASLDPTILNPKAAGTIPEASKQAINKVLQCLERSYTEILSISQSALGTNVLAA